MMITLWIRRGETLAAEMGKKAIDAEVVKRERTIDTKDYVMVAPVEGPSAAWTAERQKRKAEVLATVALPLFKDVSKTAGLPVKFERWKADLDSLPGHVGPEVPGHVEPMPGHVEPDTKKMPGHVEPDTKKMPGHV